MLHTTRGIILHTVKFRETSIIAKVYTERFGTQSYIISGVRGKKKSKAALFMPLSLVELVVYRKEKESLHRIRDLRSYFPFCTIPRDAARTAIVLFLAEVLYRCLREEEPSPGLFAFLDSSLRTLDLTGVPCSAFHLVFLVRLTKHLGFSPQANHSDANTFFDMAEGTFRPQGSVTGDHLGRESSALLAGLLRHSYETVGALALTQQQRRSLLDSLLHYYRLHLPAFRDIRSHRVLEEVGAG